jgi:hypothetical protein
MGTHAALLGITLLMGAVPDAAPLTPGDFRGLVRGRLPGRLRVPESVARRARGFRYVFVGGFQNERMPGYFSQNAKELRAHGVPRRSIHFLFPGSQATVEENRAVVRDEFLRIAGAGPEPLVVIAHSRGACDALAFALHDPQFVGDRVAALFLVQAPFGGTGLADYALGEGHPMDRRMPPGHRLLATLLGRRRRALRERGGHGGLTGLTRDASRAYWRRTLREHAEAIPVVGPKVYYVESRTRPARLRSCSGPRPGISARTTAERRRGGRGRPGAAGAGDAPGDPGRRASRPDPQVPRGPRGEAGPPGADPEHPHGGRPPGGGVPGTPHGPVTARVGAVQGRSSTRRRDARPGAR